MKKIPWPMVLAAVVLLLIVWSIRARTASEGETADYAVPAEPREPSAILLVDLADEIDSDEREAIETRVRAAIAPLDWPTDALGIAISDGAQLYRIDPPDSEFGDVIEALRGDPDIEGVEAEGTWTIPEPETSTPLLVNTPSPSRGPDRFRPNDPYYRHQWHLDQIQMPQAWTRTRGAGVVVAVIDTGVLYRSNGRFRQAPDLAGTSFVAGYDFVDRDPHADDEHGHGTHVAGTIAQTTNNGLGVAGVAPEVQIMPIRVLDSRGAGRYGSVAAGIRWAADHGAHVINMSLGGPLPSSSIRRAVEYAHRKGVVVVAAAGNSGRAAVGYPARYPHVIAVGAVRFDETLTFYSQYGVGLDIVAPGGDLRVDQNGDGLPDGVLQNTMLRGNPSRHDYLAYQGTSMAAPHVAGVAALIRSSGVTDPDAIERLLTSAAKAKSDRRHYGAGLVQANDALTRANQGRGAAGGMFAVVVALVALLGLRRTGKLDIKLGTVIAVAALAAGGLAVLPWHLIPSFGALGDVAASWTPLITSGGAWITLVGFSALPPVALLLLGNGARPLRSVWVGVGMGWAGVLLAEAMFPMASFALLPNEVLGPWLIVNAVALAIVFRTAARRA